MPDITEVFLYLTGCSLNGQAPAEEMLAGTDWPQLLGWAKKHSLVSVIGYAIEKTAAFGQADPAIRKAWIEAKEKAVRKTLMHDVERSALFAEFEKQKIWYMPLKGVVAKDYYPRFGMREMCDNDILFDPEKRAEVRKIFESRGYSVKDYNRAHHDAYEKAPILNFEMHVMLFHPVVLPKLAAYYDHVKDRLIKDEGNAYGYHFSGEEFYAHMVAHASKHDSLGGTGIRTLADQYVLNRHLLPKLDRAVVDRALAAMDLLGYEEKIRTLAEHVFGHPALLSDSNLSEAERTELAHYLYTTTYGTTEEMVKNDLKKKGDITFRAKVRYLRERLFPGRDHCKIGYPVVYRYPVLLPFFWIWRLLFRATKRIPALKRECSALRKVK